MKKRGIFALTIVLLTAYISWQGSTKSNRSEPNATPAYSLTVERKGQEPLIINVELAADRKRQTTGLMYRKQLGQNSGMLFDFGEERIINMWMKNTHIPLDMIFADSGGVIVGIHQNAKPFSLDIISAPIPARYTLEVNAGFAKQNQINVGDRITLHRD